MAFTHTFNFSWSNGSQNLSSSLSQTAEIETAMDVSCPNGVTPIELVLNVSRMRSLYVISDKAVTLLYHITTTPSTESGTSSSDDHILVTLSANVPFLWINGNGFSNPLTADISRLSVVNGGTTGTLKMRYLIDTSEV